MLPQFGKEAGYSFGWIVKRHPGSRSKFVP
jgi:hypothetical protein